MVEFIVWSCVIVFVGMSLFIKKTSHCHGFVFEKVPYYEWKFEWKVPSSVTCATYEIALKSNTNIIDCYVFFVQPGSIMSIILTICDMFVCLLKMVGIGFTVDAMCSKNLLLLSFSQRQNI